MPLNFEMASYTANTNRYTDYTYNSLTNCINDNSPWFVSWL